MKLNAFASLAVAAGLALGGQALAADNAGLALKAGQEYMIATNYPNNLHVLDLASDSLYKTCRLPDAFGPGTAMVSPDRKTAYLLNNHFGDLYGIDLDSCRAVFHAKLSRKPDEKARSMFAFALSPDGKELYSVVNPTRMASDHYEVQQPRLEVFDTAAGLDAQPVRSFPVPRQLYIMRAADDGTLYIAGPDIYKMDVKSGHYEVAVPGRNWKRPNYGPPDVLYFWPHQTPLHEFSMLYTTTRFKDEKQDPATADFVYGYVSIDLKTGKPTVEDFAPLTELYFTGLRSPKDPNQMFGVLNRLAKYDIKQQKLIKAANLDHSYYCIAFNTQGSKLYLAGTFNDIAVFDPDSLEKVKNIKLPGGDMAITTTQVFVR